MTEEILPGAGPIEGVSRVLRELLGTPRFKKTITTLLSELDPGNAALLVRTLLWEDPVFFLNLVAAAPDVANTAITALLELCRQFMNFPPEMLAGFMAGTVDGLDAERLGETAGTVLLLVGRQEVIAGGSGADAAKGFGARFRTGLSGALAGGGEPSDEATPIVDMVMPALESAAARLGREAAREGSGTNVAVGRLAEGIKEIAARNPDLMRAVAAPLLEAFRQAFEGPEAGREGS